MCHYFNNILKLSINEVLYSKNNNNKGFNKDQVRPRINIAPCQK